VDCVAGGLQSRMEAVGRQRLRRVSLRYLLRQRLLDVRARPSLALRPATVVLRRLALAVLYLRLSVSGAYPFDDVLRGNIRLGPRRN